MRWIGLALVMALIGCGAGADVSGCGGLDPDFDRDPGPAVEADAVGLIGVGDPASLPPVIDPSPGGSQFRGGRPRTPRSVDGRPVRVDARTAGVRSDCVVGPCLGLVTFAADGVTAERLVVLNATDPKTVSLNTSVYRFERTRVVLPGGLSLALAEDAVETCGAEPVPLGDLRDATYGVTIYVDVEQRAVVRVGCNGCA